MDIINPQREVKARKQHRCDWCGFRIEKGEIHHTQTYKDDYIYTFRNHLKCMELAIKLNMFEDRNGEGVGLAEFWEAIGEEYYDIHPEKRTHKSRTNEEMKNILETVYNHYFTDPCNLNQK